MKLIMLVVMLVLLNGCAQNAPRATENATATQPTDTTATEQTLLEQARAFRKAHPGLFNDVGGVLVTGLVQGGQGEQIGLMPGDVLLIYDGNPLQTKEHLIQFTNEKDAQTSITLTYLRGKAKREAVLQGGKIGIQVASLVIPSQSEKIDRIIDKGTEAYYQSLFQEALQLYRQALNLSRASGYQKGEANSLASLGNAHLSLNQYSQAIEYYKESYEIFHTIGDRRSEAKVTVGLGSVYFSLGQFQKALKYYKNSLDIFNKIGDRQSEAAALLGLGNVYISLGQYSESLESLHKSFGIFLIIDDRQNEAHGLNNLGIVYRILGQYSQALEFHKASLKVTREIRDRTGEANALVSLGNLHFRMGQYQQALKFHKASLKLAQEIGNRKGESQSSNNLGLVYFSLRRYSQAIEYFKASLMIKRAIGDRQGEANSLANLGLVYDETNQHSKSLKYIKRAITIQAQINDLDGLWQSWSGISNTLQKLNRINAAILAGKRAVNVLQGMRSNNSSLEKKLQESFLKNKIYVYHDLATLLIEQGRLAEAEQVMVMLKEEEYFDFMQRDGHEDVRMIRAGYTSAEKSIVAELDQFSDKLAALGEEYEDLLKLSPIDEQTKSRLPGIKDELERVQTDFFNLISSLQTRLAQTDKNATVEFDTPRLKELQQKVLGRHETVFISTVITQDKLYLLLTTPQGQLARHSSIDVKELNKLILALRNDLRHPQSNLNELVVQAQKLYTYLVKPLENDLQQIKPQNLMWALDGVLRYVPIATLHDGKQFLIEKYGLSLYTAAAHSKWSEPHAKAWRAVGLGVSQAHPGFEALTAVPNELKSIIRQNGNEQTGVLPGEIYLDRAFNRDSFMSAVQNPENRVLHIASHFKLQPGDSTASKLLLGDGDMLSLDEFRRQKAFDMHNVDLLTLSACDTAIGERGTGGEIESFAVLAQRKGANGVLASLWRVEDESTALLMKQLYRLRSMTKSMNMAEALRQAQIALLNGEIHNDKHDYRHPYFWAPFVMMGNWL